MEYHDWRDDIKTRYSGDYGELRVSNLQKAETAKLNSSGLALKFVHYGTEEYYVDNQLVRINSGDLLILQKDEAYLAQVPTESITQGLCIDLSERLLDEVPTALQDDTEPLPQLDMNLAVFPGSINRLAPLLSSIAMTGPGETFAMEEHMNQLHSDYRDFISPYKKEAQALPFKKANTKKEIFSRLLRAQAFIHDNLCYQFKLKELADACCISEYHFLRLFKHFFGCTPSAYLEKIRMEKARSLIEQSEQPLKEIAYQTGYTDQQYFSRRFKKQFGQPPSQIRKTPVS